MKNLSISVSIRQVLQAMNAMTYFGLRDMLVCVGSNTWKTDFSSCPWDWLDEEGMVGEFQSTLEMAFQLAEVTEYQIQNLPDHEN